MRFFHELVKIFAVALLVTACGGSDPLAVAPLGVDIAAADIDTGGGFDSALVQVPLKDRRIAIVHSQTSKANHYDAFAYNQLFASVQHQAMMAGVPFDLLDEAALAGTADLLGYDTIIFPSFAYVKDSNREAIRARLLAAQASGVGIIAAGEFLALNEEAAAFTDYSGAMSDVLGVVPSVFLSEVSATVTIADNTHPISKTYQPTEELMSYEQIWFAHFESVEGAQSTVLTHATSGGVDYTGAQIIDRASRVVHFANEEIMSDNNLLWRVIQWMVYDDIAPVSLQISRSDHVFIARNDMDQAMVAAELDQTEIPLLEILKDWKRDYNFVGSFYIDIGNDPASGQYTDWGISAPLYRDYIALGNEMGTHSWTHPHFTSLLNAAELEFEFKDSAQEIGNQLGVPVVGAAVPGLDESLFVVETVNPWLEYLSGRTGMAGVGYQGAFGFLEPQHSMMYFSLNMTPDFEAIDYLNNTPEQTAEIWKNEIDTALKHAHQPLVHWLWHDYGPTTQTARGFYTKEMFVDTVAYAQSKGAEFATLKDINDRVRTFAETGFSVGSNEVITASVNATDVGQFALKAADNISKVENWYAYDEDQVFLPVGGGEFKISVGPVAEDVTRISKLPMRAKLLSLSGDGNQLSFSMQGEGEVLVKLSAGMLQNMTVTGADSFIENSNSITLRFTSNDIHTVEIKSVNPINNPPVVAGGSVVLESGVATPIALTGSDVDGDALSYVIQTQPVNGVLTGVAPNLFYTSNEAFVGTDTFSYLVNDGELNSAAVQFDILVTAAPVSNSAPLANELILESAIGQAHAFKLSGSDNEGQPLTYSILEQPANGVITGVVPDLVYTPNPGFVGRDTLQFTVSDSDVSSEPGKVVFNVEPQIIQMIGTIWNPVTSIVIDGDLTDWANLVSFGEDPQDITGVNNEIDWREAWMAHDSDNLYIAYSEHNEAQALWGNQIFLDTDSDAATGFRGFANEYTVGADYMLEGNALFRYTSDLQNEWAWNYLGAMESAVNANNVEIKIARAELGNPSNLLLLFRGENAATAGDALDFYPDNVTDAEAVLRTRRFSYSVNPNNTIENFVPIAFSQSIKISNNASYPLTLNGFDQDNDPLSFVVDGQPAAGILTGVAPNLVYTPSADATQDLLSFRVFDGTAYSNSRSVQFFMVDPPAANNRPSANNQSLSVVSSGSLPITLTGTDVEADTLTFRVVSQPTTGSITGVAPNLTYVASTNVGIDRFAFVVNDGMQDSAVATVTINTEMQSPQNTVPQAQSLSLSTAFETAIGLTLEGTDADDDTLTYSVASAPLLGILSGIPPQLTYVPFSNRVGTDTFTYIVNDGADSSVAATVTIEVMAEVIPNRAPEANGQALTTPFATPLDITLGGRDPDQDALTATVVTQPLGGALSGTAANLVYTPSANFSGVDSFTFKVSDGSLDSATATISIDVGEQPSTVVSNPVTSLTVDGALNDWSGLVSLGSDPADVGGLRAENPLDWRQAWVAHSATDLYIAYRNHVTFTLSWGHGIYIDVDGDINTGFRGFYGEFPIGADYLIEVGDVHQYTGSGNNWSWSTTGQATVATSGEIGEVSLPLSVLNPQGGVLESLQFYFRANNIAFGGAVVDHFPDLATDITAIPSERFLPYRLAP